MRSRINRLADLSLFENLYMCLVQNGVDSCPARVAHDQYRDLLS